MTTGTDFYNNGSYLRRHPTWHVEDSRWKSNQITKLLRERSISPNRICEVGCGAGEILACMAREYPAATLVGYEVSVDAFELSQTREQSNLHFILGDFFADRDASFDLLMAIDVIEHVEDYIGFMRNLRPKATYKIFHIPLDLTVQSVLRDSPLVQVRSSLGHLHYFTKETALAALRETGYEVIDYRYTAGALELPNRGWKANLLRLPRRILFSINPHFTVRTLGGFSLLVLAR